MVSVHTVQVKLLTNTKAKLAKSTIFHVVHACTSSKIAETKTQCFCMINPIIILHEDSLVPLII